MKKVLNIVNKILCYGFFLLGVILLIVGTERTSVTIFAFEMFLGSILSAWILKIKKIDNKYWLYINLALWFNMFGEIFAYYSGPLMYDKIIHLLLGFFLSLIVYEHVKDNSQLKKDAVFFTVLGLLALWEIYEYSIDIFFGIHTQGIIRNGLFIQSPMDDTMYDLLMGMIGALLYLFFKKEKMDKLVKKDIKKIKTIANPKKVETSFTKFVKNILSWSITKK